MASVVYSIVIPMYNEEAVIAESYRRLHAVMEEMRESYELLFINDGSRDRSAEIVRALAAQDPKVRLIDFARNFGHQIAVTAGLDYAAGDAIVIIDADLQDPPEVIPQMAAKWREGYDVVYGKRKRRDGDSFFKRFTAWGYYRLLSFMTGHQIPLDTGDFRLISRAVADAVAQMPEHNRFLRGMFSWVGFRQYALEYERDKRWAGETKYPLRKMLRLAFDGIYSFSVKPLKLASVLGSALTCIGILWLLVLFVLLLCGVSGLGMSGVVAANCLLSGFILIGLGVVGAYIGRIYEETKGRPLYLVAHTDGFETSQCRIREKSLSTGRN